MTTTELNELIIAKLGITPWKHYDESFAVRFRHSGNTYRVNTKLMVEKVDGLGDDDARQLEKLLRGEQWDGTGLPPVGTECEVKYRHGGTDWSIFKCIAVDKEIAFGWCNDEPVVLPDDCYEFRPLRTERDRAVDKISDICGVFAVNRVSEQLYDAIVAGKIDGLGKVD